MKRLLNRFFHIFGINIFKMSKVQISENKKTVEIDINLYVSLAIIGVEAKDDGSLHSIRLNVEGLESIIGYPRGHRTERDQDLEKLKNHIREVNN